MAGLITGSNGLIRDFCPLKPIQIERNVITESAGSKRKCMRLTSLVQKADWANENGRYYPTGVLKEAVEDLMPAIEARTVVGELDHPEDAKIHTENVCFLVSRLWMEKKNVYAQFDVLEGMPKADMLKCLLEHGVQYSISSRGVGDMEEFLMEDGTEVNKVLPGFKLITFDAVQEPSVQGTSLQIMESKKIKAREQKIIHERKLIKEMADHLRRVRK